MPDSKENGPPPNLAPFVPVPGGIVEIYCNIFNVNWTVFDVRIRLAQLVPSPEASTPQEGLLPRIAQERAAVTMSWPEAKNLRDALVDAVKRWEAKNGEIVQGQMP